MKNTSTVVTIVLVSLSLIGGMSHHAFAANEVVVNTDKQNYLIGNTAQITLVYNGPFVTLTFPTSCESNATVQYPNGTTITLQQFCLQVITTVTLNPGMTIGQFSWSVTGPAGTYAIMGTVIGTTFSGTKQVTVSSADFAVSATSPVTVTSGTSATSTITVTALNGFTGTVSLTDSIPASLTCGAITPSNVTLPPNATATVSCSSTIAATFSLVITGTSGSVSHSTLVTFTVCDSCGGSVAASSPPSVLVGTSATSTITVTSINGFTGTVSLSDTVPAGLTCGAISPSTITGSGTATVTCSSSTAGTYILIITATSETTIHSTTVTFAFTDFAVSASSPAPLPIGGFATSTITVSAVNGFAGTVVLSDTVPPGLSCGTISPSIITGSGTATVSCSSSFPGTFILSVIGTSETVAHATSATFATCAGDFTVASSPSSLTIVQARSGTSLVTVTDVGCFPSTTTALAANVPLGLTAIFNPSSILPPGTSQLTITAGSTIPPGTYSVAITATSGTASHAAAVSVTVVPPQDFIMSPSTPVTLNCLPNTSCTTIIAASSLAGFTGNVSLTSNPSTGLSASLGKSLLNLASGFDSTTLQLNSPSEGTFTVTVTGTSGPLSHTTATITVEIVQQDFTITASPTSITLAVNATTTSIITISPLNGFQGQVILTTTVSPLTGLIVSLSQSTITMSGSSTLSTTSTIAGNYTVTITATSGSITHSTQILFIALKATIPPPQFTQSNWKQKLSLSKNNFQQTWNVAIKNPSSDTAIFAMVQINAVDGSGISFTVSSPVFKLDLKKSMTGIQLTQTFTPANIGETFTFNMAIIWGTSLDTMVFQSTSSENIRTSGSFTVLP